MRLRENQNLRNPIPPGTYPAVCCRWIDTGSQARTWHGKTRMRREVRLGWELLDPELDISHDDGHTYKPQLATKIYTLSLDPRSNLRADLVSWRGKEFTKRDLGIGEFADDPDAGFDPRNVLGKPCMLTIINETRNGQTRDMVSAVTGLPKGYDLPREPQLPQIFFDLDPEDGELGQLDFSAMEMFSEKLQEIIRKSPEYRALVGAGHSSASGVNSPEDDDDIPF